MTHVANHFDNALDESESTEALNDSVLLLLQSSEMLIQAVYSDAKGILACQRLIATLSDSLTDLNSSLGLLPELGRVLPHTPDKDASSVSEKSSALLEAVKHLVASSLKSQVWI